MGRSTPAALLRMLFGKQEGEKLYNALGVLIGLIGLVASLIGHHWWLAALGGVLALVCGADLLREKRQQRDASDDGGLVGEMRSSPPHLNPLHHDPLPPFPGTSE